MAIEQLTEEERADLQAIGTSDPDYAHVSKALRVIDAHAADRAALVAQLEAARGLIKDVHAELEQRHGTLTHKMWNRMETYVDDITGQGQLNCHICGMPSVGLVDEHKCANAPTHAALVGQVAELTQDRAALVAQLEAARGLDNAQRAVAYLDRAESAEAKVATAIALINAPDPGSHVSSTQMLNDLRTGLLKALRSPAPQDPAPQDPTHAAPVAQVAELTRQRDEALQSRDVWKGHFDTLKRKLEVAPGSEVTRLTRERDEARAQLKDARRWFRVNGKKFIASPVAANELEGIIRGK